MRVKLVLLLWSLLLALCVSPVQAQSAKDAFLDIKKKQFKKEFKYLAMMPVLAAPNVGMPNELKQLVIDEVIKKFGKRKIKLLPSSEVATIRDGFVGLYATGVSDSNREIIGDHTNREIFFRHAVDGLLSVQILAVPAPFRDDKAEWGGTSQKIKHRGDGFLAAITGGKDYGGHIAASAVRVVVVDRNSKPVYSWMGGIEVMMQRNGQKLEPLPDEKLWQKKKRVIKAVRYALKPL